MDRGPGHYSIVKMVIFGESSCRIGGWRCRLAVRAVHTRFIVRLVRFAFSLALEFFFFFALFGELFLAFFVGIIGSGH